ncbi:hypothetical protein DS2_08680 [Catenovulum agarivorans DS-2]|uniref:Lipoprotein n=1 Tax=Catenovulum agarivorans DS-2 TaxID=1328313 RepID=W7QEI8_9ALTE|nr:DUF6279 family lipoprotein [Catenovulum agarivorans]EWH10336.1 hypothetical protein DS2_08680 [Catenovulum agarivorans DS-2]
MFKKIVLFILVFSLAGCSLSFMYNRAHWWADWYLDDFVDLTSAQQDVFDQQFEQWHLWHRNEQLPLYEAQFALVKQQFENGLGESGLTEAALLEHVNAFETFWRRLLKHVAPELAQLAITLSTEQKQQLIGNIRKNNQEKQQKWDEQSDEEKHQNFIDKQVEQYQDWFGRLNRQQKQLISEQSSLYVGTRGQWLQYQSDWLAAFEQALLASDVDRVSSLIARPYDLRSETLQQNVMRNRGLYVKNTYQLMLGLSEKQQRHLLSELDDYESTFRKLHQDY